MSKNKGKQFENRAARRFKDMNKVDLMPQEEIESIFDQDIKIILGQFTSYREGRGPFPAYVANAFANISTALYFYRYVKKRVKVKVKKGKIKVKVKDGLSEDDLESLRQIIADVYRKSATNVYANQAQEYPDRNEYLSKTFKLLSPEVYLLTKKLEGLSKSERRDLTIQVYGDPEFNMKFVQSAFNRCTLSEKKKMKLLKKLYGDRFVKACGAAMTVEGNSSDCLAMIFDYICGLKKSGKSKKKTKKLLKKDKLRGLYLMAYATAYKRNKSRYFRIDQDFFKENKDLIKELIKKDKGYQKAFRDVKSMKGGKKPRNNSPRK